MAIMANKNDAIYHIGECTKCSTYVELRKINIFRKIPAELMRIILAAHSLPKN